MHAFLAIYKNFLKNYEKKGGNVKVYNRKAKVYNITCNFALQNKNFFQGVGHEIYTFIGSSYRKKSERNFHDRRPEIYFQ